MSIDQIVRVVETLGRDEARIVLTAEQLMEYEEWTRS